MPRMLNLLCVCAALFPAGAAAGAWLQEQGRAFVSLSYEISTPQDAYTEEALALDPTPPLYGYTSFWAEYGVLPWLTLGVDAGRDEGPEDWQAVAFVRLPLSPPEWRNRFAAHFGVGQRRYTQPGPFFPQETIEHETVWRIALAWGYGFERPLAGGWLAVDALGEQRQTTREQVGKVDATLGLRLNDSRAVLLQLQTGDYPGSPAYAKLLTGLIWELPANFSLETSVIAPLRTDDRIGARIGIWWRY